MAGSETWPHKGIFASSLGLLEWLNASGAKARLLWTYLRGPEGPLFHGVERLLF
jgi:hypothetical protein